MPLNPRGLGDRLFQRLRDRVRTQLSGTPPATGEAGPADPGLSSRIRQHIRDRLRLEPLTTSEQSQPAAEQGPPRSLEEVRQRIQAAGRQMPPRLLRMFYNNHLRDVEPYSFRWRDRDDPHIPLFFGYCYKDKQIEAFKLKKIQDIQVTDQAFQPRWPVEF